MKTFRRKSRLALMVSLVLGVVFIHLKYLFFAPAELLHSRRPGILESVVVSGDFGSASRNLLALVVLGVSVLIPFVLFGILAGTLGSPVLSGIGLVVGLPFAFVYYGSHDLACRGS